MITSLAYILGSSNSLFWSWFFWVHVHPVVSIVWLAFSFFALLISAEIKQVEKNQAQVPSLTYGTDPIEVSAIQVIEVIVERPPQLPALNKALEY